MIEKTYSNYMIIGIKTIPSDITEYLQLDDEEKKKMFNPVDSRILQVGIRHSGKNRIFIGDDEKDLIERFWKEWIFIVKGDKFFRIIGFNSLQFEMPFIIARSFFHGIKIPDITLKNIVDIRDKINAYRYGKTRGTLKEYAKLIGIDNKDFFDVEDSDMVGLYADRRYDVLEKYLHDELFVVDELYKRAVDTGIFMITKW